MLVFLVKASAILVFLLLVALDPATLPLRSADGHRLEVVDSFGAYQHCVCTAIAVFVVQALEWYGKRSQSLSHGSRI